VNDAKITCHNLWKVFGPAAAHIAEQTTPEMTRSTVLEQTGHVLAVRNVSLEVMEGEIFVVMGLSGSGKSTLIRCLSRLVEPTLGQILVNGADVTAMNERDLRELRRHTMSMVFQRFGLFSHRRVIDNVVYGLEVQGMPKEQRLARARQILELVELHGWENHYPHELSGGMQQRVGLARALAVDPEILLCDEPFSALDPLIRRDMQNELIRLQKNLHKTLVFITHDFLEAIKLGDRIAIMKDGEFVQIGTPEQIVAHPVNAYVREFTKDVPRVKVLTARSVMQPIRDKTELIGKAIAIDTTLEALIPLTVDSDEGVPIVDQHENLVGIVDRKAVMLALADSLGEIGHKEIGD